MINRSIVLALLGSASWGLFYALSGHLLHGKGSPVTLTVVAFAVGGVICMATALWRKELARDWHLALHDKKLLMWITVSIVMFAAGYILVLFAAQKSNAFVAVAIEVTYPLFTLLASWIFFRRIDLRRRTWAGAALVVTGVMVIISG